MVTGHEFQFALWGILAFVFLATVFYAVTGNQLAQILLWIWTLGVALSIPFVSGRLGYQPIILAIGAAVFLVIHFNRQQLDNAHSEIRRLLAESNRRMDDERRRITRQLHDEINPQIVLAKMEAQHLTPIIEQIEDPAIRDAANAVVENVLERLSSAYSQSRDIIKQTRIEVIDSVGLLAAVESLAGHYRGILEGTKITFTHNLAGQPKFPKVIAVNAYRIIQEALLNAVKHADAENIEISIRKSGQTIAIAIEDDGIGVEKKSNSDGIGLIDMRERASVLGATLQIATAKHGGTKVSFSFSLQDL